MKKSAAKKTVRTKKPVVAKTGVRAAANPASSSAKQKKPLLAKQPQSKQQAAVQAGMFLYVDDNWSTAYFDSDNLHCLERELFG